MKREKKKCPALKGKTLKLLGLSGLGKYDSQITGGQERYQQKIFSPRVWGRETAGNDEIGMFRRKRLRSKDGFKRVTKLAFYHPNKKQNLKRHFLIGEEKKKKSEKNKKEGRGKEEINSNVCWVGGKNKEHVNWGTKKGLKNKGLKKKKGGLLKIKIVIASEGTAKKKTVSLKWQTWGGRVRGHLQKLGILYFIHGEKDKKKKDCRRNSGGGVGSCLLPHRITKTQE